MKKFYFYTHLEDEFNCRRVLAMLDGKLPLTSPARFNDPFDSQLRFKHSFDEESAKEYLGWNVSLSGGVLGRLRRMQNLRQDPVQKATDKFEKETWDSWCTFCVSEVHDSLLMWSHYAKSHSGICLELEYDESNGIPIEKVRYTTHYPEIDGDSLKQGDPEALKSLLLTKSIDWHYEKEWRLNCKEVSSLGRFDGVINSPFKVSAVLFGCKFVRDSKLDFIVEHLIKLHESNLEEPGFYADERAYSVVTAIRGGDIKKLIGEFGLKSVLKAHRTELWRIRREQILTHLEDVNLINCKMMDREFAIDFHPGGISFKPFYKLWVPGLLQSIQCMHD